MQKADAKDYNLRNDRAELRDYQTALSHWGLPLAGTAHPWGISRLVRGRRCGVDQFQKAYHGGHPKTGSTRIVKERKTP